MTTTCEVAVLVGSERDWEVMRAAVETLAQYGISHEVRVLSAHRTPDETAEFVRRCDAAGTKVFIAAAGMAAHLAGAVAAHTTRPVLGVPLATSDLNGLDALLSTVQMPAGVPVATLGVGQAGAVSHDARLAASASSTPTARVTVRRAKRLTRTIRRLER